MVVGVQEKMMKHANRFQACLSQGCYYCQILSQCGRILQKDVMLGGHNANNSILQSQASSHRAPGNWVLTCHGPRFHQEAILNQVRQWIFNSGDEIRQKGKEHMQILKSLVPFFWFHWSVHPWPPLGRTHWAVSQCCHPQFIYIYFFFFSIWILFIFIHQVLISYLFYTY